MNILQGNNLELLKTLPDNSVDSVVTDPPYGLSFMNKKWDYDVPTEELWREVYRVLKPGGHLLSFSGSRTYHRMVVRIEDAGFEVRDQIMWIYGSGFPKSHNVGKAVDKLQGNEREVVGENPYKSGRNNLMVDGRTDAGAGMYSGIKTSIPLTKGQSEWEGWGTALKPAHEPIVVARKPLSEKSVAENVLKWGTGGINIDDSRIGTDDNLGRPLAEPTSYNWDNRKKIENKLQDSSNGLGRWPANIMFDEDAAEVLDEQSGISKSTPSEWKNDFGIYHKDGRETKEVKGIKKGGHNDKGGASRFFYVAKANKKDRDEGLDAFENKTGAEITGRKEGSAGLVMEDDKQNPYAGKASPVNKNNHPTVKPTKLMEYLIRLITPKGGVVLDPFMGSGSTGKAAVRNGYDFIGMDLDEEYIKIAKARIEYEIHNK